MKGHIRPRGKNTWAIKYEIGRDPKTGKRRSKWVTVHGAKRDAQRELRRILHEIDNNQHIEPSCMTLAEYLETWLADYARNRVSAKTFERYTEIARKHLIPALGGHQLVKLTPLHIQSYHGDALAEGRIGSKGGLSAQTVLHHHRLLSQALKRAVRLQLLVRNPCDAVDPPRPARREIKILDHPETARLLKKTEGRRLYVPILLAVATGMRRGEILALRWQDVDLDGATLSVCRTLEETRDGLNFKMPKTARSRRTITLPSFAVDALRRHRARQAEEKLLAGPAYDDHGLICARADGSPTKPDDMSRDFRRMAIRLGFGISFHGLRHTHLSHLLAAGVHPKVASERAGHASVGITLDTYSHVMPGLQEDAARKVDIAIRHALEE